MNIISIIEKKRDGHILSNDEIQYFIKEYCNDRIKDYQASALLMAICIQGMTKEETLNLTKAMLESGVCLDLKDIHGIKVDKHSTGGVGDKTSLVLGPMCAACGLEFAKMSGRGLGHTGGTLDKLESIEGFTVSLNTNDFINQVNDHHIAIIGQNESFVPADKKLYALRDVTGTVPSIPLIASSIMSKKLASGADVILLDVKYGDGAFMENPESAIELAKTMIDIGKGFHKTVKAEITNMNEPLGYAIGNALEVQEAMNTLLGHGPKDLEELCIHSGATLLEMCGVCSFEVGMNKMKSVLVDGSAYDYFIKMVKAQRGKVINQDICFRKYPVYYKEIRSKTCGYITHIETKQLGLLSCELGAGRKTKEDPVHPNTGIVITKKISDYIENNEILIKVYSKEEISDTIVHQLLSCFTISDTNIKKENLIYKVI